MNPIQSKSFCQKEDTNWEPKTKAKRSTLLSDPKSLLTLKKSDISDKQNWLLYIINRTINNLISIWNFTRYFPFYWEWSDSYSDKYFVFFLLTDLDE